MDKLLSGAGGTITVSTYDSNGAVADVDATNAPTLTIRDSAGLTVLTPAGTRTGAGAYSAVIPVTLTILDTYLVTWTWPNAATRLTAFEVVGSFLYSLAEFRAFDPELANATTYPPARVRDIRETVEERFAQTANVSFTRRGRRESRDGDGSELLVLYERQVLRIVSLSVAGTITTAFEAYPDGRVVLTSGVFTSGLGNVDVLYEHGYDPPPAPVVEAAKRYGRELIVKGAFDDMARASEIQTELGVMRITHADSAGLGIPEIDSVLARYGYGAHAA